MYNVKTKKTNKRNDIPTPHFLCKYLYDIISSHYKPDVILDPCAGDGRLTQFFDCKTIQYEIKDGNDFFDLSIGEIECDMVLMNPPFNSGNGKTLICELFLDRVYNLIKDKNVPIIMIAPMGFRLNQVKKSKRWQKLRDDYPPITTIITLPIDVFDDIQFHTEIICFNTSKIDPHYFLPNSVIE